MTHLEAYERALTLFGELFFRLKGKKARYFLASIKSSFVFFLYGLILNGERVTSGGTLHAGKEKIFPRTSADWSFGAQYLKYEKNDAELWNADKVFFTNERSENRVGEGVAVLSYGLDLHRAFELGDLEKKEKIGALVNWTGGLKSRPYPITRNSDIYFTSSCLYYFLMHIKYLFDVLKELRNMGGANMGMVFFIRHFINYAFCSARVRGAIQVLSRNKALGRVLFSDVDSIWGNAFMLWSKEAGFAPIAYAHGSSLYANKRRYFYAEKYYIYAMHHERLIKEDNLADRVEMILPHWLKDESNAPTISDRNSIKRIAFVTGMERNLEAPFTDQKLVIGYINKLAEFTNRNGLSLVIKSHKLGDWHERYNKIANQFSHVEHIQSRWSLIDLKNVDLAVLAATETTLALQLLSLGIPVVTCIELVPEIRFKHFGDPEIQLSVSSVAELIEMISQLQENADLYRNSRKQAKELFTYLMPLAVSDLD